MTWDQMPESQKRLVIDVLRTARRLADPSRVVLEAKEAVANKRAAIEAAIAKLECGA